MTSIQIIFFSAAPVSTNSFNIICANPMRYFRAVSKLVFKLSPLYSTV